MKRERKSSEMALNQERKTAKAKGTCLAGYKLIFLFFFFFFTFISIHSIQLPRITNYKQQKQKQKKSRQIVMNWMLRQMLCTLLYMHAIEENQIDEYILHIRISFRFFFLNANFTLCKRESAHKQAHSAQVIFNNPHY